MVQKAAILTVRKSEITPLVDHCVGVDASITAIGLRAGLYAGTGAAPCYRSSHAISVWSIVDYYSVQLGLHVARLICGLQPRGHSTTQSFTLYWTYRRRIVFVKAIWVVSILSRFVELFFFSVNNVPEQRLSGCSKKLSRSEMKLIHVIPPERRLICRVSKISRVWLAITLAYTAWPDFDNFWRNCYPSRINVFCGLRLYRQS